MKSGCLDIGSIASDWKNPDQKLYTDLEKIHIWRIQTETFSSEIDKLKLLLTSAETKKINRYQSAANRQTRITSRAILKVLLGRYLSLNPADIKLTYNQHAKPIIENVSLKTVNFNVSHSGNWILMAIALNPIGIDIEYVNTSFTYQNLLDFSFNVAEKHEIEKAEFRHQQFYKLWTRKEALLKATGKGLIDELAQIPSLDGQHRNPSQFTNSAENWQILSFKVDENHVASTAFMPIKPALHFFNFQL